MTEKGFVFVDIETTGLVAEKECILEIGFALYDRNLRHVESKSWLCLTPEVHRFMNSKLFLDDDHRFVREMHNKNGLWTDLMQGFEKTARTWDETVVYRMKMIKQIQELLESWEVGRYTPMCGSSLRLDRAFLEHHYPEIDAMFSYRIIDASSFMEFDRVISPDGFGKDMQLLETVRPPGHRVLTDIQGSVNTLRVFATGSRPLDYDNR